MLDSRMNTWWLESIWLVKSALICIDVVFGGEVLKLRSCVNTPGYHLKYCIFYTNRTVPISYGAIELCLSSVRLPTLLSSETMAIIPEPVCNVPLQWCASLIPPTTFAKYNSCVAAKRLMLMANQRKSPIGCC